jgi:hypothetical protein
MMLCLTVSRRYPAEKAYLSDNPRSRTNGGKNPAKRPAAYNWSSYCSKATRTNWPRVRTPVF